MGICTNRPADHRAGPRLTVCHSGAMTERPSHAGFSPEVALGQGTGPLRGIRVVEIAGIGPGPHACMILADLGADVIRLERSSGSFFAGGAADILNRGRPSVGVDLKHPDAPRLVLDLVVTADVLVEGMRPGAMERLGLGPEPCLERNPRLVYGRMTGWGQTGPLATAAGHDINYVSVTGALHGMGQDPTRPHFPSNLVGDFGGGSTYLVIGILSALWERQTSGQGQIVDAAIVDGTVHLNAIAHTLTATGQLTEQRAHGLIDGGAAYYDLYETADGEHLAVGPLEPPFYAALLAGLGLDEGTVPDRLDPAGNERLREVLAARFAQRTRAEWEATYAGTEACVTPVLRLSEAPDHPHLQARQAFIDHDGVTQPAPAPRFSRTPPSLSMPPQRPGANTRAALAAWGIDGVDVLIDSGVVTQT